MNAAVRESPSQKDGAKEFMNLITMIKSTSQPCECLERSRLQISQELDRLNGSFRRKEQELIGPIVGKYSILEQKVQALEAQARLQEIKLLEQEQSMLV